MPKVGIILFAVTLLVVCICHISDQVPELSQHDFNEAIIRVNEQAKSIPIPEARELQAMENRLYGYAKKTVL